MCGRIASSTNWERSQLTLSTAQKSHSVSLTFDNGVFELIDHVPPKIPNNSHSAQLHIFEDNAAGTKPKLKARNKNAQSRLGLVV